jgi:hypothetical protein
MYDAHIRAWKRHLERIEMKTLLASKFRVTDDWRHQWNAIEARRKAMTERKWLT